MKKVRASLIGCGGRLRTVVRVLNRATDQVEYAGVYDPVPESMEAMRELCGADGRVYESAEAAATDPQVDWVLVGSPNDCHAEQVIAAFRAGKHVFCEKPLATTLEDALAMKQAWQASGKRFVLGLTLRHSLLYRTMREWISAGRIGQLVSMEFNETLDFNHGGHIHSHPWRRKTARSGSHLLEKCCHDIDLAQWMAGSLPRRVASFGGRNFFVPENEYLVEKIGTPADGRIPFKTWRVVGERVNPFASDNDVVDNQVGLVEFANQVRATFHTNCVAGIPERRMLLLGTEGAIRCDLISGRLEYRAVGFDAELESHAEYEGGGHGGGDPILGQDLAATMLHDAEPAASMNEGLISAVICFAMDEAMHSGTVVDCRERWRQAGMALNP